MSNGKDTNHPKTFLTPPQFQEEEEEEGESPQHRRRRRERIPSNGGLSGISNDSNDDIFLGSKKLTNNQHIGEFSPNLGSSTGNLNGLGLVSLAKIDIGGDTNGINYRNDESGSTNIVQSQRENGSGSSGEDTVNEVQPQPTSFSYGIQHDSDPSSRRGIHSFFNALKPVAPLKEGTFVQMRLNENDSVFKVFEKSKTKILKLRKKIKELTEQNQIANEEIEKQRKSKLKLNEKLIERKVNIRQEEENKSRRIDELTKEVRILHGKIYALKVELEREKREKNILKLKIEESQEKHVMSANSHGSKKQSLRTLLNSLTKSQNEKKKMEEKHRKEMDDQRQYFEGELEKEHTERKKEIESVKKECDEKIENMKKECDRKIDELLEKITGKRGREEDYEGPDKKKRKKEGE